MKDRGFTLIELVVVLAVLGILAGIGVPYLMGYRNRVAHKLNVVNLKNTRWQVEAVYQIYPEDFSGWENGQKRAENGQLDCNGWGIPAPKALGVTEADGVIPVAEGTEMWAVLEVTEDMEKSLPKEYELDVGHPGTFWVEWGGVVEDGPEEMEPSERPPAPEVPSGTVPGGEGPSDMEGEVEQLPTEPVVPEHTCMDRDANCLCDIEGCETILHEETLFVDNGNCKKCGLHYIHRGVADYVCDTCGFDLLTGQPHVCSWEEGACRCRCGVSRCDHGSSGIGKCSICGNFNVWMEPCENCKKKG